MTSFEPEILCDLADVYVELGEHRTAVELIAQAQAKWPKVPAGLEAFVDLVLAGAHNGLADFQTANRHAAAASAAYAAMPWPARHELALIAYATACAGLGQTAAAQRHQAAADSIGTLINQARKSRRANGLLSRSCEPARPSP